MTPAVTFFMVSGKLLGASSGDPYLNAYISYNSASVPLNVSSSSKDGERYSNHASGLLVK